MISRECRCIKTSGLMLPWGRRAWINCVCTYMYYIYIYTHVYIYIYIIHVYIYIYYMLPCSVSLAPPKGRKDHDHPRGGRGLRHCTIYIYYIYILYIYIYYIYINITALPWCAMTCLHQNEDRGEGKEVCWSDDLKHPKEALQLQTTCTAQSSTLLPLPILGVYIKIIRYHWISLNICSFNALFQCHLYTYLVDIFWFNIVHTCALEAP